MRLILRLLTVFSALLLLAAVVAGIDSYGHKHQVGMRSGNTWYEVRTNAGRFSFVRMNRSIDQSNLPHYQFHRRDDPDPPIDYRLIAKWWFLGFAYTDHTFDISSDSRRPLIETFQALVIPAWALILLLATLPAVRGVIWWRRRHRRNGPCCPKCGYNLTGTLAAGKIECPECGANIAVDAASQS